MANSRHFTLFSLRNLAYAKLRNLFIKAIKSNNAIPDDLFAISSYATKNQQVAARDIFQNVLLDILLHAVVDDDRKTVKIILNAYPELLLVKAQQGLNIQSQYTWLKIDAESEDALSIAVKRKQIKMIELLLPYYDRLEQTEEAIKAKAEALSAWKAYEIQKNEETGEDEIVIPSEYANYAKSLIDVFKEETFPNGVKGKFSAKTEDALKLLFDILLPKQATKLDDYIDPELLLLALHQAYCNHFTAFQDSKQRDAFCVRTLGLAQSVLTPETAKIFCDGLYYVVAENISELAAALKLRNGKSFYRASRESLSGLGFEYLCCRGYPDGSGSYVQSFRGIRYAMLKKNYNFSNHYAAIAATATPTPYRS